MDLGKEIENLHLERIHHSKYYWAHLWFVGRGQNISINRSLEEVDSNPLGWLWRVQDFSGSPALQEASTIPKAPSSQTVNCMGSLPFPLAGSQLLHETWSCSQPGQGPAPLISMYTGVIPATTVGCTEPTQEIPPEHIALVITVEHVAGPYHTSPT